MDIINKNYILPALAVIFIFVVFMDQNSTLVPMKLILGSPFQIPLNFIIIVSMLAGAGCSFIVLLMLKKMRSKKNNDQG